MPIHKFEFPNKNRMVQKVKEPEKSQPDVDPRSWAESSKAAGAAKIEFEVPEPQAKTKPKPEKKEKTQTIKAQHPSVHGSLEIIEEDL